MSLSGKRNLPLKRRAEDDAKHQEEVNAKIAFASRSPTIPPFDSPVGSGIDVSGGGSYGGTGSSAGAGAAIIESTATASRATSVAAASTTDDSFLPGLTPYDELFECRA